MPKHIGLLIEHAPVVRRNGLTGVDIQVGLARKWGARPGVCTARRCAFHGAEPFAEQNLLHVGHDDLFIFTNGGGDDTIIGFSAGLGTDDVLNVIDFGFANLGDLLAASDDSSGDTVISLDGNDSVTLIGVVNKNTLHEDDFLFV